LASGAAIALSSAASAFPWHSATCCR
jgi:hypothetical protein